MPTQITIPSPGESISEVVIGPWHKQDGEWVEKDEIVVEIESDKVTLEVPAPDAGVLRIAAQQGAGKNDGDVIGSIDTAGKRPAGAAATPSSPAPATLENGQKATSVAKKVAADKGVDLGAVKGTGPSGRVTKADVLAAATTATPATAPSKAAPPVPAAPAPPGSRGSHRERLSTLRQRIAERLVAAQRTAAMLTTFNEADMFEVMRLRKEHKESFQERHGVALGFMSFFVKACVSALRAYATVNAYLDGAEVEYHDYVDVSIAVGTGKGLVVPVIRNAEALTFADVERTIADLAKRAREGKLTLAEMSGGTFTISNGGVYGSMMSTPILNPPQSAILGMHRIIQRPVEDPSSPGQIALRPMMYLALSYDHRIIDGEQAVRFLVHVKECIEKPDRLLLDL